MCGTVEKGNFNSFSLQLHFFVFFPFIIVSPPYLPLELLSSSFRLWRNVCPFPSVWAPGGRHARPGGDVHGARAGADSL
jgi:hypothetical protein